MNKEELSTFQNHKYYDVRSNRVLLPLSEMRKLPLKWITKEELYYLKCGCYFNPTAYYLELPPSKREVGSDLNYRYFVADSEAYSYPTRQEAQEYGLYHSSWYVWLVLLVLVFGIVLVTIQLLSPRMTTP